VFVFSDVFAKTAAIVESLVGIRRPFVDGNKRTGAVVAGAVLLANGYELDVSNDELEALMLWIAGDSPPKPTTEEIANWLRDHSGALT
jgi:death-on-curing protein